jgi:hypothetical protein
MQRQTLTKAILAVCSIAIFAGQTKADLLWDNGPIMTHPGGMTLVVPGADRSAISPNTPAANLMGIAGFDQYRLADDFTITSDFTINSFRLFAYRTDATVPQAHEVTARIFSGGPPGIGTIVWGDTSTDVMSSSGWAPSPSGLGLYRTDTISTINTLRRVQEMVVSGLNINLRAGTYWLDYNFDGVDYVPPVSSPTAFVTGTAFQSTNYGNTYSPAIDNGAGLKIALPFIIEGTTVPEPGVLSVLALGAVIGMIRRRK